MSLLTLPTARPTAPVSPAAEPYLVTVDVGNRKRKYRRHAERWVAEDSLVRRPTTVTDHLDAAVALRPFVYEDGPAAIDADERGRLQRRPFLVGADALRGGSVDLARIGTAHARIASDAYKILHLASIADALPRLVTHVSNGGVWYPRPEVAADILFAGGLPAEDGGLKPALLAWLKGDVRRAAHAFRYGETLFRLRIVGALIVPQHVAAAASLVFDERGVPKANGALRRKRLMLDSGGGTTDFGGSVGLEVIPGTEGGTRKGAVDVAVLARQSLLARWPRLQLTVLDVLAAMDMEEPTVFVGGQPERVDAELAQAAEELATAILADVTPRWETHLSQSEVNLAGGNARHLFPTLRRAFQQMAEVPVNLLDRAIYRIAEGADRLARHRRGVASTQ